MGTSGLARGIRFSSLRMEPWCPSADSWHHDPQPPSTYLISLIFLPIDPIVAEQRTPLQLNLLPDAHHGKSRSSCCGARRPGGVFALMCILEDHGSKVFTNPNNRRLLTNYNPLLVNNGRLS